MKARTVLAVVVGVFACSAWAQDPLEGIVIQEDLQAPYDRRDYKHWKDEDGDGQDARQEALIAESYVDVSFNEKGLVNAGLWMGPYTGYVTRDPGTLDIDHLVPLKEAHRSGAANWTPQQREDYANALSNDYHLIAVWRSANRSKADKDPAHWMPPNRSYWCEYLDHWISVKRTWGLSMDTAEADAIREGLAVCADYEKRDAIGGLQ